jgi:hypothetical protein
LPGAGVHFPALVDRDGDRADDGGVEELVAPDLGIVALGQRALEADGREQLALRDLDLEFGRVDPVQRRVDGRMLVLRERKGRLDGARHEAVDRLARREFAWLDADHLTEARNGGAQVGLGQAHLRASPGKPGLGLRDVRARDLADVEAVAGLAELLLQNLDVVALQVQDRRVAQNVHVGRGAVEEDVLLRVAQVLPGADRLRFGLADPIAGAAAIEDVLVELQADAAGVGCGLADVVACASLSREDGAGVVDAGVGRRANAGSIARLGPRHVLVRGAHAGPLRVKGRVAVVGPRQGACDRLGREP